MRRFTPYQGHSSTPAPRNDSPRISNPNQPSRFRPFRHCQGMPTPPGSRPQDFSASSSTMRCPVFALASHGPSHPQPRTAINTGRYRLAPEASASGAGTPLHGQAEFIPPLPPNPPPPIPPPPNYPPPMPEQNAFENQAGSSDFWPFDDTASSRSPASSVHYFDEREEGEWSGESDTETEPSASARPSRSQRRKHRQQLTAARLSTMGIDYNKYCPKTPAELAAHFKRLLESEAAGVKLPEQAGPKLRISEYFYTLAQEYAETEEDGRVWLDKIVPPNADGSRGEINQTVLETFNDLHDGDLLVLQSQSVKRLNVAEGERPAADLYTTEDEDDCAEQAQLLYEEVVAEATSGLSLGQQPKPFVDLMESTYVAVKGIAKRHSAGYDGSGLRMNINYRKSSDNYFILHKAAVSAPTYILIWRRTLLLQSKYILDKCANYRFMPYNAEMILNQGVPGSGKTTDIRRMATQAWRDDPFSQTVIVTQSRASKHEINLGYNRSRYFGDCGTRYERPANVVIRTMDGFILNFQTLFEVSNCGLLLVDEGLLCHGGCIDLIASLVQPREIVIYGDRCQIRYCCRLRNYAPRYHSFLSQIKQHNIYESNVSYRCPADVCGLFAHLYPGGFISKSGNTNRSLFCKGIGGLRELLREVPPEIANVNADLLILCFTQMEKSRLLKAGYVAVSTVHEAQGRSVQQVLLVRLNRNAQNPLFEKDEYVLVALSRHTHRLRYFTCVSDRIHGMIEGLYGNGGLA